MSLGKFQEHEEPTKSTSVVYFVGLSSGWLLINQLVIRRLSLHLPLSLSGANDKPSESGVRLDN